MNTKRCGECGRERGPSTEDVPIAIRRGDVGRAMDALDRALSEARFAASDEGVVLMMAILLVEQLAKTRSRDPVAVLNKMAHCFVLKRKRLEALQRCN